MTDNCCADVGGLITFFLFYQKNIQNLFLLLKLIYLRKVHQIFYTVPILLGFL
jgi:hypothetical protein